MKNIIPLYHALKIFIFFFALLLVTCAGDCKINGGDASTIAYTITVSRSHGGSFTKIQDAIESIPSNNNRWIRIHIKAGTYREQVKIAYDKECIVMEGEGSSETVIVYDGHQATDSSATFTASANNFVAKFITFKNSYNARAQSSRSSSKEKKPAVAMRVYGDKAAFYNCTFVGYQDTIWDVSGRHFFKFCRIQGAVDFIWGTAQSVYEDTSIVVSGDGFVTAQGRERAEDQSGFVFIRGTISGNGKTYLGRAYGAYSRVIFQATTFSNVVDPRGWYAWNYIGHEGNFTYVEAQCVGPGANTSRRVPWMKTLNAHEMSQYQREHFIDHDGWIHQQP